jgi:mitogen-activated protein kinase organizer 1
VGYAVRLTRRIYEGQGPELTGRAATRDPIQTLREATSSITSLSLPDTNEIITSSLDGHIRAYDLRMGTLTEDLVGHPVTCVVPSKNSPRESMLVSSSDGSIRIFDRTNGSVLQTFSGHAIGSVRNRAIWGYAESLVLTGDDKGHVWGYNVLDVGVSKCDTFVIVV